MPDLSSTLHVLVLLGVGFWLGAYSKKSKLKDRDQ